MAKKYQTLIGTLEYNSAEDETNPSNEARLVAGSHDVLIDQRRVVKSRAGYTVFGDLNEDTTLGGIRPQAPTWNTSTGTELPMRAYSDQLEAHIASVDGTDVDEYVSIMSGLDPDATARFATWWDTGETLDLLLFVQGDDNIYEWSGGVAVVLSIDSATLVTKTGVPTWAENRFYTGRNKVMVCVRTGTEYTYTAGENGTQLTVASTVGLIAGDVLVQKVVTNTDKPASGRNNYTIFSLENQTYLGSEDDEEVFVSSDTDFNDFSFSTPRLAGEGALLTLEHPTTGFGALGSVALIFGGRDDVFQTEFTQITVGGTLSETLKVKKLQTGIDQSAQSQELIVPIGNSLAYISYEPALRIISNPSDLVGVNPKVYSNPIQPDFDAEDWTGAAGVWFKNSLHFTSRVNSKLYLLAFNEDADGKVRRFWQAPQRLPIGALSIIQDALHGHSNVIPETYQLFFGGSDREYEDIETEDKLPINYKMVFAYRSFKDRENLKTFDEYYSEGKIKVNTDVTVKLLYDFGGSTQIVEKVIEGDDDDITYDNVYLNSLGQPAQGTQPLGGASVEPIDALRYRVTFEIAKEDFNELQEIYEAEGVDIFFSVLARGMNAALSPRRDTEIRK